MMDVRPVEVFIEDRLWNAYQDAASRCASNPDGLRWDVLRDELREQLRLEIDGLERAIREALRGGRNV